MDNVSHTLIGLSMGEAAHRALGRARLPLWIAGAVANNLPDLDLFLTKFVFTGKIGYLLHHRGHSHTLAFSPFWSLLLLLGFYLWGRKKEQVPWAAIVALSISGVWMHIFADYWNSYGVIPFWPLDHRWLYGDMVFIVEPWLWILLIPPLFFSASSIWGRGVFGLLFTFILSLAWIHEAVPRPVELTLTIAGMLWFLVQLRIRAPWRISGSLGLLTFGLISLAAISYAMKGGPLDLKERGVQSFPGNPLCWTIWESGKNGDDFVSRVGYRSVAPALWPSEKCPPLLGRERTAEMRPMKLVDERPIHWLGEFRKPYRELELLRSDCEAEALLRFMRFPFWEISADRIVLGDLRFDRGPELGFAEVELNRGPKDCPRLVPNWEAPFRSAL